MTTAPLQGGHQDRVGGTWRGRDTAQGCSGWARPWQGFSAPNPCPKPGPGEPKPADAHQEAAPASNSCHKPSPCPESGAAPTPLGPPHVPESPTSFCPCRGGAACPSRALLCQAGLRTVILILVPRGPPSVAKAGLSVLETPSYSSRPTRRPQHAIPHIQASHEPSCEPPASQPRAERAPPPRGDVPGWTGPVRMPRSRAQALAAARSRGWRRHLSSP